jgi:hypothetical protein
MQYWQYSKPCVRTSTLNACCRSVCAVVVAQRGGIRPENRHATCNKHVEMTNKLHAAVQLWLRSRWVATGPDIRQRASSMCHRILDTKRFACCCSGSGYVAAQLAHLTTLQRLYHGAKMICMLLIRWRIHSRPVGTETERHVSQCRNDLPAAVQAAGT